MGRGVLESVCCINTLFFEKYVIFAKTVNKHEITFVSNRRFGYGFSMFSFNILNKSII